MKKSDLKDFMVVQLDVRNYERENEDMYLVTGNTLVSGDGYMNLRSYDENMECIDRDIFFDNSIGTYSIIKIFEIKKLGAGIENFFNKDNLKLIWERPREIDWSKVPRGINVRVRNSKDVMWQDTKFIYINSYEQYKFYTNSDNDYGVNCWKYCEIIDEIKEEWYK